MGGKMPLTKYYKILDALDKKTFQSIILTRPFIRLDQRGAEAAAGASESLKALAHASLVVALSTSAAFEAVVVSKLVLSDVTSAVTKVNTVQHGGAASCAGVVLDNKEVLLTLVAITSEGNVNVDLV
jgi:hypothetical protein